MNQIVKLLTPQAEHNYIINLDQQHEDQELVLLFIGKGKEDFEIETVMHHEGSGTGSLTTVRGVLLDEAKATVKGLIKIEKQAGQAQAFLEQRMLLIGDKAQAKALPQLEIETNEVKASHAATVGRFNEEELFYLQSRGLSKKTAQEMIIKGFFQSVIDKIENPEIRHKIEKQIDKKLLSY